MLKKAASRAMWLAKGAAIYWGAAFTLAVVMGVASMALGATEGNFILGKNNVATALTKLTGNVDGSAMQVQNTNAGADDSALNLSVQSGEAPMQVNSSTRVAGLNADQLDGKDATSLTRVALMRTSDTTPIPEDGTQVTYGEPLSITAPAAGFVRINGNVTVRNASCIDLCVVEARARHINSLALSVNQQETVDDGLGNIGLDGVFPVQKGANTFDIRLNAFPTFGELDGWYGTLTAEYSPYGPSGTGTLDASGAKATTPAPTNKGLSGMR